MAEPLERDNDSIPTHVSIRESKPAGRRVYLDSASPPVRSILRVVIITLLLIFIAGSVQAIVSSLAALVFLISLSVFFAYLIDPIVRLYPPAVQGAKS